MVALKEGRGKREEGRRKNFFSFSSPSRAGFPKPGFFRDFWRGVFFGKKPGFLIF
jgi:hypothetical protein